MNRFSHKNFFCPPDNDGQFYKHRGRLILLGKFNRKIFYLIGNNLLGRSALTG